MKVTTQSLYPQHRAEISLCATTVLGLLVASTVDPAVAALGKQWVEAPAQAVLDARTGHRASQGAWRARYDDLAPLDRAADDALRFAEAAIVKKLGAAGVALFHRLLGVGTLSEVTRGSLAGQVSLVNDLRARAEAEADAHGLPAERLAEVFATNDALAAGITAEQEAKRAWKAAALALADAEDSFRDAYRVFVRAVQRSVGDDSAAALLPSFTRAKGGSAAAAAAKEPSAQAPADADNDDVDDEDAEG